MRPSVSEKKIKGHRCVCSVNDLIAKSDSALAIALSHDDKNCMVEGLNDGVIECFQGSGKGGGSVGVASAMVVEAVGIEAVVF